MMPQSIKNKALQALMPFIAAGAGLSFYLTARVINTHNNHEDYHMTDDDISYGPMTLSAMLVATFGVMRMVDKFFPKRGSPKDLGEKILQAIVTVGLETGLVGPGAIIGKAITDAIVSNKEIREVPSAVGSEFKENWPFFPLLASIGLSAGVASLLTQDSYKVSLIKNFYLAALGTLLLAKMNGMPLETVFPMTAGFALATLVLESGMAKLKNSTAGDYQRLDQEEQNNLLVVEVQPNARERSNITEEFVAIGNIENQAGPSSRRNAGSAIISNANENRSPENNEREALLRMSSEDQPLNAMAFAANRHSSSNASDDDSLENQ